MTTTNRHSNPTVPPILTALLDPDPCGVPCAGVAFRRSAKRGGHCPAWRPAPWW